MVRVLGLFITLLLASGGDAFALDEDNIVIWYDRSDGSAYLKNNNPNDTIALDGYTIASEHKDLIPGDYVGTKGWKAIEDIPSQFPSEIAALNTQFGLAAFSMGSANPSSGNLTELTLNPTGLEFSPGEMWFIGKPFTVFPIDDAGHTLPGYAFIWKSIFTNQQQVAAIIGDPVPEPSSLLLATLAGFGLVGVRIRGLRSGARRPQLN